MLQKIIGCDLVKDICYIEISLEDFGIQYQVGDVLGVWFKNDIVLVEELIGLIEVNVDEIVEVDGQLLILVEVLISKLELILSYLGFVKVYQEVIGLEVLVKLLEDKVVLCEYLVD